MTDLYAWHREVMSRPGERVPVHEGDPQCGWYVVQIGDGPFIPASIYCDRDELKAEIGGDPCDPLEWWLMFATRPISQEEYRVLLGQALSGNYVGPTRTRARWTDPAEIARDFLNYDLISKE